MVMMTTTTTGTLFCWVIGEQAGNSLMKQIRAMALAF